MASRAVSGTIAAVVLVLCVGGCSSDTSKAGKSDTGKAWKMEPDGQLPPPEWPPGVERQISVDLGDGVTMKFALIPTGEFMMGSHESAEAVAKELDFNAERFENEHPQHRVEITKPFYLGVHEVTQAQYEKVMGDKPWSGEAWMKWVKEGPEYPATYVTWENAQEFCRKLSAKEGRTYRLPTEAEWEYACRAGSKTRYCFGDDVSELGTFAWYCENAWRVDEKYAHQVGLKRANVWGLYDMHGNVHERCADWYDDDYYEKSPGVDPEGPSTGSSRVERGGGWGGYAGHCRSAFRAMLPPEPDYRFAGLGFRVALVPAE